MRIRVYFFLLALVGSFFLSDQALAFTIKGIRAGATVSDLKERLPSATWEDTGLGLQVATFPLTSKETVAGSRINEIRLLTGKDEIAHEIIISVQCGINGRNLAKLMISNFGQPHTVALKSTVIEWRKNQRAMILYTGQPNAVDSTCHTISLLDESATVKRIKMLEYIDKGLKGNPNDF